MLQVPVVFNINGVIPLIIIFFMMGLSTVFFLKKNIPVVMIAFFLFSIIIGLSTLSVIGIPYFTLFFILYEMMLTLLTAFKSKH